MPSMHSGALVTCATPWEYAACAVDIEELQQCHGKVLCPVFKGAEDGPGALMLPKAEAVFPYSRSSSYERFREQQIHELVATCATIANDRATRAEASCLVCAGDDVPLAAAVFALLDRRRLLVVLYVDDLRPAFETFNQTRSILLFMSSSRLAATGLDSIRDGFFDPDTAQPPPWGIMVGSVNRISAWIARCRLRVAPQAPRMKLYWFGE